MEKPNNSGTSGLLQLKVLKSGISIFNLHSPSTQILSIRPLNEIKVMNPENVLLTDYSWSVLNIFIPLVLKFKDKKGGEEETYLIINNETVLLLLRQFAIHDK